MLQKLYFKVKIVVITILFFAVWRLFVSIIFIDALYTYGYQIIYNDLNDHLVLC